ncbi:helix-turn-helix domain-containing protein [Niveibacterium sp.]|uniref:helix-turn-helix domain-containing protein n=1 Tax=Niveibacterium sp. TaxID=2017444 RepID=UPI0035B417FD
MMLASQSATLPTVTKAVKTFDSLPGSALLSVTDVCTVLQRSRSSIYRDFEAGRLTPVKVGCSTRVRVEDVRRLAQAGGAV